MPETMPETVEKLEPVTLSAEAAEKVAEFVASTGSKEAYLRLGVQGGGCSGYRYQLALDEKRIAIMF